MVLIESNKGKKYCVLKNSSGKKWIFDIKYMEVGLCLYQPSSAKGRMVKKFLLLCSRKNFLHFFLKQKTYVIEEKIFHILCELFHYNDIQYSIFFGTPGVHCKTVLQISRGTKILGYCKLAKSKEIYDLFKREYELLIYLHSVNLNNIPHPIYVKEINDKYIYCQTTIKTINSSSPREYNELINNFLLELSKKTEKILKYDHSELYKNLHNIYLKKENKNFKEKYLYYLSLLDAQLLNKEINVCVSHRDFTPWNMFIEGGELFVFDWEYSVREYLPMMDLFHFEIQSKLMDDGLDIQKIIEEIDKSWERYVQYISKITSLEAHLIFLAYLLDFIALYISRSDNLSKEEIKSIMYRFDLLQYVVRKYNLDKK